MSRQSSASAVLISNESLLRNRLSLTLDKFKFQERNPENEILFVKEVAKHCVDKVGKVDDRAIIGNFKMAIKAYLRDAANYQLGILESDNIVLLQLLLRSEESEFFNFDSLYPLYQASGEGFEIIKHLFLHSPPYAQDEIEDTSAFYNEENSDFIKAVIDSCSQDFFNNVVLGGSFKEAEIQELREFYFKSKGLEDPLFLDKSRYRTVGNFYNIIVNAYGGKIIFRISINQLMLLLITLTT